MDAEELDLRHLTSEGWLSWDVVQALIERGHLDLLRREAEAGDFNCAEALGRLHLSRNEPDAALAVYKPYAETGWPVGVERIADILTAQGAVDAVIDLVRPLAEAGDYSAVGRLAELLAHQDRIDEVFALLMPSRPGKLVEVTAGKGRDEEILAMLRPLLKPESQGLQSVVAKLLERMGRVDEAVKLLLSGLNYSGYYVNHAEQIADILARHDPAKLAEFAAGEGKEYGRMRLARLFEEQGEVEKAAEVLAPHAVPRNRNESWWLADLLARHGRVDEAIEVLRPAAILDPECLLRPLCVMLIGQGRLAEARAIVDEVAECVSGRAFDWRMEWIESLVECDHLERAVADLRADPEADTDYVRTRLAELLTWAGGLDEAESLLAGADDHWDRNRLSLVLVFKDRPEEAVALVRG